MADETSVADEVRQVLLKWVNADDVALGSSEYHRRRCVANAVEFAMDRSGRSDSPLLGRTDSGWNPISVASAMPLESDGATGPCAVMLKIDVTRPGPFIRQGRWNLRAGCFLCDSTGQYLLDAVAFIEPKWPPAKDDGVSEEMLKRALREYRPMRAVYYPEQEMRAALAAALAAVSP